MGKFVHLHGHTEYSLLDGLPKISKLVKETKNLGMDALAITDHGSMYGTVEFYKACVSEGIKPIIGCEVYVAPRSHKSKEGKLDVDPYHLILLAKNYQGYRNLMKLVSISYLDGFYYKPRVDKELLKEYHEGLICLSGCPAGELIRSLEDNDLKKAEEIAKTYINIFGQENYFFELQSHPYRELAEKATEDIIKKDLEKMANAQEKAFKAIKELSPNLNIPIVATNDFHYIKKEDAEAQDALICIQTGKLLTDINRLRMIDTPDYYLKSPEEMLEAFKDLPEALDNSTKIADMVDLEVPLGKSHFPIFKTPNGETSMEYLRKLTYEGAEKKLKLTPEEKERIEYELDIIEYKGYADYFLVVSDFMEWAHQQGIITNTRGSAAGSIVLYSLGVTNLNPLDYLLPFERFLTKFRPSLPDIDADLADDRRDDVIRYVMKKYGEDRVAHIVTFGTMMGRAALRDIGRVMGMSYGEVDSLAKLVPPPHQGFHKPLHEVVKEVSELSGLYASNPQVKKLFDLAMKIEGTVRHASVHAAGIVISPEEITHFTPLQKEANGDKVVCQYEMFSVEDAGLVKMDFLGIRNLSILGRAVEYVKQNRGVEIDLNQIKLDDKKAYDLLARGETMGIFQLSSEGMTKYLTELRPSNIPDLAAMVALYRPGPLGVIPEYIARKRDPRLIKYYDPRMQSYMQQSLGLLVYQEDVLYSAINIAGYSWEDADKFRKAMGKKIPAEMEKQKGKFVEGCVKNGMDQKQAEDLFARIAPFAAYGFNKCLVGETLITAAVTGERITIKSLYESNKKPSVLSLKENKTLSPSLIRSVRENGVKSVFELVTRRGLKIKSTDNHPFLTINGWKELKDLRVGDRIGTARYASVPDKPFDIEDYKIATLGYLLSEGNLCHPHGIYYYSTSKEEISDFIGFATQFENSRISLNHQKPAISVYVGKKDLKRPNFLFQWLSDLGLLKKKATDKKFPEFVFQLNQDQLSLLLAKMWQGDGLISPNDGGQFFYATSSETLAFDMQHLLLRLGIISTVHKKGFRYRGKIMVGWTVNFSRYSNIKLFSETVGKYLIGEVKEACRAIVAAHPILSGDLSPISARGSKDIIPAEILPIIKEAVYINHSSLASFASENKISVRLLGYDRKKIGYLRETVQNLACKLSSDKLQTLANSDIYWDEIVKIEPKGEEMTYDLTVPKTHNFVANDIIVHNSHAASYAMVAYHTAYMKANYPVEFMAAVMTAEYGDSDKIADAIEECKKMGIPVLPPDVNKSFVGFTIEKLSDLSKEELVRQIGQVKNSKFTEGVRFGLSAIKNVGVHAIESIIEARKEKSLSSLMDLLTKVDTRLCNKKTMESLIKAGALDHLGSRAAQLMSLEECLEEAHKLAKASMGGQVSLFDGIDSSHTEVKFDLPEVEELPLEQLLVFEKELLGFYLHEPPYIKDLRKMKEFISTRISVLDDSKVGDKVVVGGVLAEVKKVLTKKDASEMAFLRVFDGSGEIECVVFPKLYAVQKKIFLKEQVVVMWGRLDKREDNYSLVVDNIDKFDPGNFPVVDISTGSVRRGHLKEVEIEFPRIADGELLKRVHVELKKYPGTSPISILIPSGNTLKKMDLSFRVNPGNELVKGVESILGSGSVRLI